MNKKTQQGITDDHEEDVSFEGRHMYLKFFIFTSIFAYTFYTLHNAMLLRLKKRHARNMGTLDEFLQEEEDEKESSFFRRNFGKMIGGGEEDGIDGGIEHTTIGGDWLLKTLDGQPFGSKDLAGRYYLIYFGSTLSPDVCPFTLHTIMKALTQL